MKVLIQNIWNNCFPWVLLENSLKNHTEISEISNLTSFCAFIQFIMSQKSWEPKLRNSIPLFAIYWTFTEHSTKYFTKNSPTFHKCESCLVHFKRFVHFVPDYSRVYPIFILWEDFNNLSDKTWFFMVYVFMYFHSFLLNILRKLRNWESP